MPDEWSGKLDAYLDGELSAADATALAAHLRMCSDCTAAVLQAVQMKLAIRNAGKRYQPSSDLRTKITQTVAAKSKSPASRRISGWQWRLTAFAAVILIVAGAALNSHMTRERAARQHVYSELADLHVATLASATPVDVLSTDRHTVKPWFQGKIPFTFNLPELQGTDFSLLGGRVTYMQQMSGAQLIYQIRKHNISVFIVPERGSDATNFPSGTANEMSFNVESWEQNGLRYFVIGDVNRDDIHALSKLLRSAG